MNKNDSGILYEPIVLTASRNSSIKVSDCWKPSRTAAVLAKLRADCLAHTTAGHVSAEAAHRLLLDQLGFRPPVDLDMRLGEASGAAVALLILRTALACHTGMATFAEAGVSDKRAEDSTPKTAG